MHGSKNIRKINYGLLTHSCELGNETSSSIKGDMFLGHLPLDLIS